MKNLAEYKKEIKKATTQEELTNITYEAFLSDDKALSGKSLYQKVVTECVKRSFELEEMNEGVK